MILAVEIFLGLVFLIHLYRFFSKFTASRSRSLWTSSSERSTALMYLLGIAALFFPMIYYTLRFLSKGMIQLNWAEQVFGIESVAFGIPAFILALGWADGVQVWVLKKFRGNHSGRRLINRIMSYLMLLFGLALCYFQLHFRFGYGATGIIVGDIWGRWDLYRYDEIESIDKPGMYYHLHLKDGSTVKFENFSINSPDHLVELLKDRAGTGPAYGLVIHGGAGNFNAQRLSEEQELAYTKSLRRALDLGWDMLERGADALDVVEAVIIRLENDTLFNAGKGAVLSASGKAELDASIMDGHNRRAGAVAGLKNTKNPIRLARLVMERSPHVFLYGAEAEELSKEWELPMVENDYFKTPRMEQRYLQMGKENGTVGVVVLDKRKNLAAGTSTGGMMGKANGRIGDSPIIGAGTYADNASCAVSCTGHGEYFIRGTAARDVAAQIEYGNKPLAEAARLVITERIGLNGGTGGLVAIDTKGHVAMPFNTTGMFRGAKTSRGIDVVALYGDQNPI